MPLEDVGFIVYLRHRSVYDLLTDEEIGRLIRCCLAYCIGADEPVLPGNERLVWPFIKEAIDSEEGTELAN